MDLSYHLMGTWGTFIDAPCMTSGAHVCCSLILFFITCSCFQVIDFTLIQEFGILCRHVLTMNYGCSNSSWQLDWDWRYGSWMKERITNVVQSHMHLDLVEEDIIVLNTRALYHISRWVTIAQVETIFLGKVWNLMRA